MPAPSTRALFSVRTANAVWLSGLCIYFLGNVFAFTALSFAPASLCAALLATVVVANAICARLILKERLQRCDYHGGALIIAGIAVAAAFAPHTSVTYTAADIWALFGRPSSIIYLAFLTGSVLVLNVFVRLYERKQERKQRLRRNSEASDPMYIDGIQVPRTRPCDTSPHALATAAAGLMAAQGGGNGGGDANGGSSSGGSGGDSSIGGGGSGGFTPGITEARPPPSPPPTPPAVAPPPAISAPHASPAKPPFMQSGAGAGAVYTLPPPLALPTSSTRPRKRHRLSMLMPFAYPVILGTLETFVYLCQKAVSSMALLTVYGDSQLCHAAAWLAALLLVAFSLLVIHWLRKGLRNLEASRLLPVEYGTVTSTSIVGGLILFDEGADASLAPLNFWMMALGIGLIVAGCALVGRRKTIKKQYDPGYKFNREVVLPLQQHVHRHMGKLRGWGVYELSSLPDAASTARPRSRLEPALCVASAADGSGGSGRSSGGSRGGKPYSETPELAGPDADLEVVSEDAAHAGAATVVRGGSRIAFEPEERA